MSLGYNKEKYVRIVDDLRNKWAGNREEAADAIDKLMQLIEVISRSNDAIWEISEEFRKERDAAVADLRDSIEPCMYCRSKDLPSTTEPCLSCTIDDTAFEWRGATNENT